MSTATTGTTTASVLAGVREIEPLIRQYAPEAERDRHLSDKVADAMRERGLYRMWRPKALGGLEVDPMTAFRVFEEVARIDSGRLESSTVMRVGRIRRLVPRCGRRRDFRASGYYAGRSGISTAPCRACGRRVPCDGPTAFRERRPSG
jgi:hypothetical protein